MTTAAPGPSRRGLPSAPQADRHFTAADRMESYSRWCEPVGWRPARLSGCLCASVARSGDYCGPGSARSAAADTQVDGATASSSSVARNSSEIAPSLSQMPK